MKTVSLALQSRYPGLSVYCISTKERAEENFAMLGELAARLPVGRDSASCNRHFVIDLEIRLRALLESKNRVKREITGLCLVQEINDGLLVPGFTVDISYSDRFDRNQMDKLTTEKGLFQLPVPENRTPVSRWIEPMLVVTAIFASTFLLFSIR